MDPKREKKIVIKMYQDVNDIVIKVQDTGIGISSEDQKHLFTKFYRSRNSAAIQGTGLGLVICKKIVEKHGGTIGVESKVGKGTTMTIKLPRLK